MGALLLQMTKKSSPDAFCNEAKEEMVVETGVAWIWSLAKERQELSLSFLPEISLGMFSFGLRRITLALNNCLIILWLSTFTQKVIH